MNAPESFDDPLPVLPGVVVFGVLWQNDFGQPKLVARILKPVHQDSAVLPGKVTKTATMNLVFKFKVETRQHTPGMTDHKRVKFISWKIKFCLNCEQWLGLNLEFKCYVQLST